MIDVEGQDETMAVIGDRVQVPSLRVGQVPREGVVVGASASGGLLRVRWSGGEESTITPSMGSLMVVGKARLRGDNKAARRPKKASGKKASKPPAKKAARRPKKASGKKVAKSPAKKASAKKVAKRGSKISRPRGAGRKASSKRAGRTAKRTK